MPKYIVYTVVKHYMHIEAANPDNACMLAEAMALSGHFNKEESEVEFTDATLDTSEKV